MCGIAGLIHRGKTANIGQEMTSMLQSLKHRGPDSTGFALYGDASKAGANDYVMRFKVAEQAEALHGFTIQKQMKDRRAAVDERMSEMGARVAEEDTATDYAFRYRFTFDGDLRRLVNFIEDIDGVEILSVGKALELVKDLGDAT
ncbi:MAG: glutamine amidotransferase, partial [Proteobacteria bacterium]|nr:glutamine amidotransferase [Pseudomonadota bacterium]